MSKRQQAASPVLLQPFRLALAYKRGEVTTAPQLIVQLADMHHEADLERWAGATAARRPRPVAKALPTHQERIDDWERQRAIFSPGGWPPKEE